MIRGWQVSIDRGGTFTDVVAIAPDGSRHVRKLLSADADGASAVGRVLNELLAGSAAGVDGVRMGTTVATNALLERKGSAVCLAVTKGFADVLLIGTQQRPELFALEIVKPAPLHTVVVEIDERVLADGSVRRSLDPGEVERALSQAREADKPNTLKHRCGGVNNSRFWASLKNAKTSPMGRGTHCSINNSWSSRAQISAKATFNSGNTNSYPAAFRAVTLWLVRTTWDASPMMIFKANPGIGNRWGRLRTAANVWVNSTLDTG